MIAADARMECARQLDAAIVLATDISALLKGGDWDDEIVEMVTKGADDVAALAAQAGRGLKAAELAETKAGKKAMDKTARQAERHAEKEAKAEEKAERAAEAAEKKALGKAERYTRVQKKEKAAEQLQDNSDLAQVAAAAREKAEAARAMAERLEERLSHSPASYISNQRLQRSHRRMSRQLNDGDDEQAGPSEEYEVTKVGESHVAARGLALEEALAMAERAVYEEMLLKKAEERFRRMKAPGWLKSWRRGGHRAAELSADAGFTGDCMTLGNDGETLACVGGNGHRSTVGLYSAGDGSLLQSFEGHEDLVICVAMDGEMIASAGRDQMIKVWSAATGECTATLHGSEGFVYGLALRKGVLISGEGSADSGRARLWTLHASEDDEYMVTGRQTALLGGHLGAVWSVGIGLDVAVSGSHDATCQIWLLSASGSQVRSIGTMEHPTNVYSVSVEGDAAATACGDKIVRLWSISSCTCLRQMEHCAALPGGRRLSLGEGLETDAKAFRDGLFPFCVHLAGAVLVSGGGPDKNVKVWNLADTYSTVGTDNESVTTLAHGATVRGCLISPRGWVASVGGKDKRLNIWRAGRSEEKPA